MQKFIFGIFVTIAPIQFGVGQINSATPPNFSSSEAIFLEKCFKAYTEAKSKLPSCTIRTDISIKPPNSNSSTLGAHEKYWFNGNMWRYESTNVVDEPLAGPFVFNGKIEQQKLIGQSRILITVGQTDVQSPISFNSFFKPYSFLFTDANLKNSSIYSLTLNSDLSKLWKALPASVSDFSVKKDANGNLVLTAKHFFENKLICSEEILFDAKNNFYPMQSKMLSPTGDIVSKYTVLKLGKFPGPASIESFPYPSEAENEEYDSAGKLLHTLSYKVAEIKLEPIAPSEFALDLKSVTDVEDVETGTTFSTQPDKK